MKRFALSLVIVLAATALAFAATKTDDNQAGQTSGAASGQNVPAKSHARPLDAKDSAKDGAKDGAKTGDVIIIKGKAGSVTTVDYGKKPEIGPGSAKPGGQ